jgi:REP element-mobilizing transposase RayT
MFIQPYQREELSFAWCHRVYYRFQTYRKTPQPLLAELDAMTLNSLVEPYGLHILEASGGQTEVRLLASLTPEESVSASVGKIKGRVSKWLREQLDLAEPRKLLSRGYFACTTGKASAEAVDQYLEQQGEHHGYASRANPPLFVQTYPLTSDDERRLSTPHAVTHLRHHLVLATWRRKGVFGRAEGEAIAGRWREIQEEARMVVQKVSFVPDHVHLAVHVHPSVSPAELVTVLMNTAQELCWKDFGPSAVRAGIERLWQPSAYLGSYGDLESPKIAAYIRRWEEDPQT